MIPPFLASALAKPVVRYGTVAGVVVLVLSSIWLHGYSKGRAAVKAQWDTSLSAAAANAVTESVKADAMESAVVKATDHAERVIEAKAKQIKKEVRHHARKDPKPLSAATTAMYDRLISLPNETGRDMPAADLGAGASEISRGRLAPETPIRVPLDAEGESVELTTEELVQAAVDFAEKYALMKNAYKGFSDWNDGRERLELERLQ